MSKKKEMKKRLEKRESINARIQRLNELIDEDTKELARMVSWIMECKSRIKDRQKEIKKLRNKWEKLYPDNAVNACRC